MDPGTAVTSIASEPTFLARIIVIFIFLLPLVLGLYLMFFSRQATKLISIFDFAPPGRYPLWDKLNHMFYTVSGFVLLFVGLKLFPYAFQSIKEWIGISS